MVGSRSKFSHQRWIWEHGLKLAIWSYFEIDFRQQNRCAGRDILLWQSRLAQFYQGFVTPAFLNLHSNRIFLPSFCHTSIHIRLALSWSLTHGRTPWKWRRHSKKYKQRRLCTAWGEFENQGGATLAKYIERQFIPLLMHPKEPQGCQKMRQDPQNSNLEVWCANMELKLHNLWKTV